VGFYISTYSQEKEMEKYVKNYKLFRYKISFDGCFDLIKIEVLSVTMDVIFIVITLKLLTWDISSSLTELRHYWYV
jgi:hypothetical protein